jgi:5-methylcytosine-specific restriction endonuclease McrA
MNYDYLKIEGGAQVLLLNADYQPLSVCSYRKAVILSLKNKVQVLSKRVIRLINYVRLPFSRLMSTAPTRNLIMKRDGYICSYCGAKEQLTIDHILPTSKGGQNTWENMTTCCLKCNSKKGDKLLKETNMILHNPPTIPFSKITLTIKQSRNPEWTEYNYA